MTENNGAFVSAQSSGVPLTRAEAVAAWREHRRARREEIADGAARSDGPDGFVLRRWRRAGVFGAEAVGLVQELISDLLTDALSRTDVPEDALDILRQCWDGEPVAQLPAAVRAVLEGAAPDRIAAALKTVRDVDLPWLTAEGRLQLDYLMSSESIRLDRENLPTTSQDPDGAFALHQILHDRDVQSLSLVQWAKALPWAPLGVLDDLIDSGVITRRTAPWNKRSSKQEQAYLLARLAPEYVDPEDVVDLHWTEALDRRRFLDEEDVEWEEGSVYDLLQSAADGDTSVLKNLEYALPRSLVLELRRIQDGALTGNWDPDILADQGLWRLMSALWSPKTAVNPGRSEFHELTALQFAYDALILGEIKKARLQLDKIVEFVEGDRRRQTEAWNMRAYLALLDEDLDSALIALSNIVQHEPMAEANLQLVRRRQATPRNDRERAANPYLELGLPHGSQFWKARWRDLRREFEETSDRDQSARVNWAQSRIRQAERDEDWSDIFTVPLDADTFRLPSAPPVLITPPVGALSRRTDPQSAETLAIVRDRAVAGLLPTLLNAPRRPDHQHRTTA
ncbi:hypothetical protein V2W30_33330 [Streptomyces sp. Q6]|uniref:Uncharacterized protein n=1 Tax=Streptomyces citrinus TaxID=3118173 RepID=A0ACD5AKN4_9ACTN